MAVVVEAVLTREKLISLIDEGHEQTALDYKRILDLSQAHDRVNLAKDILAMFSNKEGGYIVVGADNNGKPVAGLTPRHVASMDESWLRPMIEKYINDPFVVRSAHHTIDGCSLVLIYAAPSPHGFCVVTQNGEHEVENPPGSGKMKKSSRLEWVRYSYGEVRQASHGITTTENV